ncbi:hypothetical protein ACHAPJ_009330 [Fusarium lateritium]
MRQMTDNIQKVMENLNGITKYLKGEKERVNIRNLPSSHEPGLQPSPVTVDPTPPAAEENERLMATWLKGLGDFVPTSDAHIEQLIPGFENFEPKEKDKHEYIMQSNEMKQRLSCTQPSIVDVRLEDPLEEAIKALSALSIMSAIIKACLVATVEIPVLEFFCGLRTIDSCHPDDSGPMALLNSLNRQLLKFLVGKTSTDQLDYSHKRESLKRSRDRPKYALDLFKECTRCFLEHDTAFMILDSFSLVLPEIKVEVTEFAMNWLE